MAKPYTGPDDRRGITAHGLKGEDELRQAKEFAEMIVDTVREGLLILDLDLHVEAANESFYRMFGVSREVTEGRLVYELGNRQWDIAELRRLLEDILPEKMVFNDFEVEHEFEGIGRRVMLLNARQLNDHHKILLAIEDVTERRRAEHTLHESEERHQLFVKNAKEYAIFHVDIEGRITSWNMGAKRLFGYTAEEIIDQPQALLFTKEDRAAGAPEREREIAIEEGQADNNRWHVRTDGTRFWATGSLEALFHMDGRLRGFTKILRDNTEQKEAEEALRESYERYHTLFESIDEGFCIIEVLFDAGGEPVDYRFLETNPAFKKHTDLHNAEGKRMRELEPKHEAYWFETYGRVALTGKSERFTNLAQHLGGRWYDVHAFRVGKAEERKVAILFDDITARKQTEQELHELNERLEARVEERTRQVRELASTLTMAEQVERRRISRILHDDLQQLLYGIKMMLNFVYQDTPASDPRRTNLTRAEEWLSKAVSITRQLTVDLSPQVLNTEGLTDTLVWLQTQMRELHALEVELKAAHRFYIPDEDIRVLLFQIVRELLFNVVKHAETDHATVVVEDVDHHIAIRVSDEGCGFDMEKQAAKHEQDKGLGLFSVRERLGLFGGHMEIESAPGKGTRVTLHVPV